MKRVGLVTVTFNSGTVIDGFLDSCAAQDFLDWRLYIIDNASKDDSLGRARRDGARDPRIVVVANAENRGVAAANNQGIYAALADGCDGVLLINNDVEFGADLVSGMVSAMERLGAEMLVPKIYYFEPKDRIWCAGGAFRRVRAYMTAHFGEDERDVGQYDEAARIEYAPTCCMMVRAEVFARIGVMDENFFVYFDDAEFCYRAMKAKVAFWYSPSPVLYHKVSSLTGPGSDFSAYNGALGHAYFLRKHKPGTRWAWLALVGAKYYVRALRGGFSAAARARLAVELKGFRAGLARVVPAR